MKFFTLLRGLAPALCAGLLAQGVSAQTGHPPLWKVGGNLHVFGSFHLLPADVQWRTPALAAALEKAEVLVMETDVAGAGDAKAMQPLFVKYGLLPAGQTLPALLPPRANAELEKLAGELGMPPAGLAPMRPWLAAVVLGVQFMVSRGFDPNKGVEQQVLAWAKQNGKKLDTLESMESQLRIFADLPREEEIALLVVTLRQVRDMPAMLGQLLAAYRRGDFAALEKILNAALNEQPALRERVIGERHRQWLPKLERMIATGRPQVVIVGAAHVTGGDGIIALLRARGHKVEGPE